MGTRKNHKQHPPLVNPAMRHTKPLTLSDCSHHYVIEIPNGPFSLGECKKCGNQREYRNAHSSDIEGWR